MTSPLKSPSRTLTSPTSRARGDADAARAVATRRPNARRSLGFAPAPAISSETATTRRRGASSSSSVVAEAGPRGGWDNADEDDPPSYKAYVPVPGFGEFYDPARPGSDEERAWEVRSGASKLAAEAPTRGRWEPPPDYERRDAQHSRAQNANARGGFRPPPQRGSPPPPPNTTTTALVPTTQRASTTSHDADDLERLGATWSVFRRAVDVLRWTLPITGGLACWVAAAPNLGATGTLGAIQPALSGGLTVGALSLLVALGAAAFSGAQMCLLFVARFFRGTLGRGVGRGGGDGGDRGGGSGGYYDPSGGDYYDPSGGGAAAGWDAGAAPPPRRAGRGGPRRAGRGGPRRARADAPPSPPTYGYATAPIGMSLPAVDPRDVRPASAPPKRERVDLPLDAMLEIYGASVDAAAKPVDSAFAAKHKAALKTRTVEDYDYALQEQPSATPIPIAAGRVTAPAPGREVEDAEAQQRALRAQIQARKDEQRRRQLAEQNRRAIERERESAPADPVLASLNRMRRVERPAGSRDARAPTESADPVMASLAFDAEPPEAKKRASRASRAETASPEVLPPAPPGEVGTRGGGGVNWRGLEKAMGDLVQSREETLDKSRREEWRRQLDGVVRVRHR